MMDLTAERIAEVAARRGPPGSLDALGWKYRTDKCSAAHDYCPIYEYLLDGLEPGTLLEVGVFQGASLRMWRDWLGPGWEIVGVDIEPALNIEGATVKQADATKPGRWIPPELAVVIDDGSHAFADVVATYGLLWPRLRSGGLYVIEDLGAPEGQRSVEWLAGLAYRAVLTRAGGAGPKDEIAGVEFYDELAVVIRR